MDYEEKLAECLRICGPDVPPGLHRMAPELCPFKEDEWKRPTRNKEYGWARKREDKKP